MAETFDKWSNENPWLGLDSYSEGQRLYGRDREIEALTEIINNNPAIVLYGRSGIGKSSLLKAGVFPRIRQQGMVPVYIRLTHNTETSYTQQIEDAVSKAVTAHDLLPPTVPDLGLWDFMHRHHFTDADGNKVTPVIVLDQFEEIFTLTDANHKGEITKVFIELADTLNGIKPDKVIQAEASLNKPAETKTTEKTTGFVIQVAARKSSFNYTSSPSFRFVLSLRDDSLYLLERNCAKIPALKVNRFNLNALDEDNAMEVITKPAPSLFTDEEASQILEGLAYYEYDDYRVVDPAILSLFLFSYYREKGKVSYDDIFERYYLENIQPKFIRESSVSYIEDNLLTERGNRTQVPLEDIYAAGVSAEEVKLLLSSKILKTEKRKGTEYVEFSHDRLCEQALKHRQEREANQQARKSLRRLLYFCLGSLATLAVAVSFYLLYNQLISEKNEKEKVTSENKELALKNDTIMTKNQELKLKNDTIMTKNQELELKNDTITTKNQELEQQKVTINTQKQDLAQQVATITNQNKELEQKNSKLRSQTDSISRQKHKIDSMSTALYKFGFCNMCNGRGITEQGALCSQCEGTGRISSTDVVSGNTIIQLRKVSPKKK